MARHLVSCNTLGDLDGGSARAIVDAAIREAVNDLEDRAEYDEKPRDVVIKLRFEMRKNREVDVTLDATAKMPPRRTAMTTGQIVAKDGRAGVRFSALAPDDPMQGTFDEVAP